MISGMKQFSQFHVPASQVFALENVCLGLLPISNQTVEGLLLLCFRVSLSILDINP